MSLRMDRRPDLDSPDDELVARFHDGDSCALDVLLQGRTAILIAHRLSTAMRADRIFVVDEGGILESGSHEELLAHHGRYAEMYATWISHLADESSPSVVSGPADEKVTRVTG